MYVLVLIMMLGDIVKVQTFDILFIDAASCKQVAYEMEDFLMSTRPTPESAATSHCFQIPESV
mgnify:CR=1 FL=1